MCPVQWLRQRRLPASSWHTGVNNLPRVVVSSRAVAANLTTSDLLIVGPTVSPPRYRRRRGLSSTPSLYLSVGAGRRGCCTCAGCYAPRRFPVTRHLAAASTDAAAAAAAAAVCVTPGIGTVNSQRPRPTNLEFLNCSASTYDPISA